MTRTISLETLFIPLLAISMIGAFAFSNAYAQQSMGSCTGDCSAPTIGLGHDYKQIVRGGVAINGKAIDITGFTQTIPTTWTSTGSSVNVALKVYEDSSVGGYLEHTSITIADCSMEWSRAFDKSESLIVFSNIQSELRKPVSVDACEIVRNVDVRSNTLDPHLTEVTFSFQFAEPLENEAMSVKVWDSRKNVARFHLDEAFTVTGNSLNMAKPMNTMSDVSMEDSGPCNRGTVLVMHPMIGLTSCILSHHVSIWNNYGWTT